MAAQLHYLTVQDILWINLQVTDKVHRFSFAKLEEATYYQYAYGESRSVIPQAARFLVGFPKLHPLESGNDATTFVACLSFLKINGLTIELQDTLATAWYESVQSRSVEVLEAVKSIAKPILDHHHAPKGDIRQTVKDVISQFPCTLLALGSESAVSP